jgi:hypothetical protein
METFFAARAYLLDNRFGVGHVMTQTSTRERGWGLDSWSEYTDVEQQYTREPCCAVQFDVTGP